MQNKYIVESIGNLNYTRKLSIFREKVDSLQPVRIIRTIYD